MKSRRKHSFRKKKRTKKIIKKRKRTRKKTNKIKNKTLKKKFKKVMCSPKKKDDILSYTCYTSKSLHKLKNIWNKRHPDEKILTNKPYEIWNKLKFYMKETCNNEQCWLKHKCLKEHVDLDVKKHTFAPSQPITWKKKPNEWLTSVDINRFMKQYEKTYKSFEFLGPSPIDYDHHMMYDECVWEELCKFDLSKYLNKGKTNIGIIFNLDPHYKEGSHWVAVYIKARNKGIYYFDSYGEKTPKRILKFMKNVQKQSSQLGEQYKIYENKKRHQYSNSECGMYCLYFIKHMLHTGDFKTISTKKISDNKMKKLRNIYFNKRK